MCGSVRHFYIDSNSLGPVTAPQTEARSRRLKAVATGKEMAVAEAADAVVR